MSYSRRSFFLGGNDSPRLLQAAPKVDPNDRSICSRGPHRNGLYETTRQERTNTTSCVFPPAPIDGFGGQRAWRCLVALSTNMLGDNVPQQTGLVE